MKLLCEIANGLNMWTIFKKKKAPLQMFDWIRNMPPIGDALNVEQVDCKCIEFVAVRWCAGKYLRLNQTIRSHTCGDLEISLLVIRLGVTRLKKSMCLLDLFWRRGRSGVI